MTNTLQSAATAAQPAVDPNTMVASTPLQQSTSMPSVKDEMQQFVDEWALNPSLQPGTRTWVDPSKRADPATGEYLAAWKDQAPVAQQATFTPADASANAAAIGNMTAAAQAAQPKPVMPTIADYWSDGVGAGAGGPGDGSGIGSGGTATGQSGEGIGTAGGGAASSAAGDDGDGVSI